MKKTTLVFFALLIYTSVDAQIKLEKRSFLNGKLELLVPAAFKQMEAELIDVKYPNRTEQPNAVLTNEGASINVIINYLSEHMAASQVAEFKDFQMAQAKKSRPDAEWLEDGIRKVNGKDIGYLKFIVQAIDQRVFNYMFFTELEGRILVISFNCTEKRLPEWKAASEAIFSSIMLK